MPNIEDMLGYFAGLLVAVGLAAAQPATGPLRAGTALPASCVMGQIFFLTVASPGANLYGCTAADTWTALGGTGAGVPAGTVMMITSGACPTGFSEEATLDGVTVIGTVTAHGDVGTTGGANDITPTGTVSAPSFTGSSASTSSDSAGTPSGSVSQPTLAMDSYTPAGSNGTVSFTPSGTNAWPVGVPTFSGSSGTVPAETITWPAGVPTFSGNALSNHQHGAGTYANTWPAGVPTVAMNSYTPAGTNAATTTTGNCANNAASGTSGGAAKCLATNPSLPVPAEVFTGTPATLTGTISWPAGVPTIGGSDTAASGGTPSGTVAWPAGVPTNGTVSFTPGGTVAWPVGVPAFTGGSGTVPAQAFTGTPATLTGAVSQPTFAGSALGGHAHTVTAAGTVGVPTFAGAQFDNRSAFLKVIFCKKD